MKEFGQSVTFTGVDGTKRDALIIGVRTEPENRQGSNGEPLLSLGYFTPGPNFGNAEPVILHDVPHSSIEKVIPGVGRWDEKEPQPQQAAAAEIPA